MEEHLRIITNTFGQSLAISESVLVEAAELKGRIGRSWQIYRRGKVGDFLGRREYRKKQI